MTESTPEEQPEPDGQKFVITFTASAEVTPAAETTKENA